MVYSSDSDEWGAMLASAYSALRNTYNPESPFGLQPRFRGVKSIYTKRSKGELELGNQN